MRHSRLDPADWPALTRVLSTCFATPPELWDTFRARIGEANLRTVHVDGVLAGGLGIYRMGQWFGGRSVALGGFAGVGVALEHRGSGVAAAMMAESLRYLRAEGVPLAGLYASTQALYRSVGFEQAGDRVAWKVPLSRIGIRDRTLPVTRVDVDSLRPFYRPAHGNLDRNEAMWSRLSFSRGQGDVQAFRIGDGEGWMILQIPVGTLHYPVMVRDMAGYTAPALRRMWTLLADCSSLGTEARWFGAALDHRVAALPEHTPEIVGHQRWMLRILDVRGVLEGRGYAADGELDLEVEDPLLAENAGKWRLVVRDGRGTVEAGGSGALRIHIRGLAPLFSGLFPAEQVAALDLANASPSTLAAATRIFASPAPWMADMY